MSLSLEKYRACQPSFTREETHEVTADVKNWIKIYRRVIAINLIIAIKLEMSLL